jgi:non-ribosomal peptide synthetase component F
MESVARDCAASTYMVLHTALAVTLSGLGAGDDIPVGVALSGRGDDLLEGLVGCLVNTVVIRTDLADDPTYRELVARVRDSLLAAYNHQELPFNRVVELVNPTRTATRHPLVQVGISYHRTEPDDGTWPIRPVTATRLELDLLLQLAEHRTGGITGELFYAAELFEPGTAHRIVTTTEATIAAMCHDMDHRPGKGTHR